MKFRLLRGNHSQREPHPEGKDCHKCSGKGRVTHAVGADKVDKPCTYCLATGKEHYSKEYKAKDSNLNIVESPIDLEARFGREKFQNIDRALVSASETTSLMERIQELERENALLRDQTGPETEDEPIVEETQEEEVDIYSLNLRQLRRYAKAQGIEINSQMGKSELIEAIESLSV